MFSPNLFMVMTSRSKNSGGISPLLQKVLSGATPRKKRGAVFGFSSTANGVGIMISSIVSGWTFAYFSLNSILQFYSLIVYECAYILLWFLSATDGEPYGIILLLGGIVELIFDVIAIKKWNKISQLQKTRKCKAYMFEKSV